MCYTNETLESSGSEGEVEIVPQRRKSNFVRILRESMTNALFRGSNTKSLSKSGTLCQEKKEQDHVWDLTIVNDSLLETVITTARPENAVTDCNPENYYVTSTNADDKILVLDEHQWNQVDEEFTDEEDINLNLESVSSNSHDIDRACNNSIKQSFYFGSNSPIPTVTCSDMDDFFLSPSPSYDNSSNREEEEGRERNDSHYNQSFTDEDKNWIEQNFFIKTENSSKEEDNDSSYESLCNEISDSLGYDTDFLSEQQQQKNLSCLLTPSSPCFVLPSTSNESWQCSQSSPFPLQIFFPSIHLEVKKLISCSSTSSSEFYSLKSPKHNSEASDDILEDCISSNGTDKQPTSVPSFVSTQDDRDNSSELTLDHDKEDNICETKAEEPKEVERQHIILLPSSHDTPADTKHSPRRNFLSRMYSNKKKRIVEEETMHFLKSCKESKLASTFLLMKGQNEQLFQESYGVWPSTTSTMDCSICHDETDIDVEPWQALFD